MHDLRLYARLAATSVRSQMQYPASFLMATLGNLAVTGMEFVALAAAFTRFGSIGGWTLPEVALLYGTLSLALAIGEGVARGFDSFHLMVKQGDFDRVLLRPRSTALQVVGQELLLRNAGRAGQGLAVLLWGAHALEVAWTPARVLLIAGATAAGACLFAGLFVLQATACFWTVESIEVVNCLTYGGVESAQVPLSIYRPWFRRFFTYVVPLAAVSWLPARAVLGRLPEGSALAWAAWASPLAGVAFLLACLQVWEIGVRRYCSTGS